MHPRWLGSFHRLEDEGGGLKHLAMAKKYGSRTSPSAERIIPLAGGRRGFVNTADTGGEKLSL
jgi:hypothetical protein